ncbi:MAG: hypothetical protein ABI867_06275 [Kofleriaceae bacterium]
MRTAGLVLLLISGTAIAGPSRFVRPPAPPVRVVMSDRLRPIVVATAPAPAPLIATFPDASLASDKTTADPALLARLEGVDFMKLAEPARSQHLLAYGNELSKQFLKSRAQGARDGAKTALLKGVKIYRVLTEGAGVSDEALYAYASLLQSGKYLKEARGVYDRLLKDYPNSRRVPAAYLAFAEYFFEARQLADADAAYKRVRTFPKAAEYWYATYKLAWVDHLSGRFQEALEGFYTVSQGTRSDPDAAPLAHAARLDFVRAYAEIGKADKASLAFRRVDETTATEMLERLAALYLEQGKHGQAISLHQELIKRAPKDPRVCAWQVNVVRASLTLSPVADRVREIENLVKLSRALETAKTLPAGEAADCRANSQALSGGLARVWHSEGLTTRNSDTLAYAVRLYQSYLQDPGVQDHAEVARLYAEASWVLAERESDARVSADRWEATATAFAAITRDVSASHLAVLAWMNAQAIDLATIGGSVDATKPTPPQAASPLVPRDAALVTAVEVLATLDPKHGDLGWMRFVEAAIYRRASQHDQAARILYALVASHPDAATAEQVAILAIDSYIKLQQLDTMLLLADRLAADPRYLAGKPELRRTVEYVRSHSMRR